MGCRHSSAAATSREGAATQTEVTAAPLPVDPAPKRSLQEAVSSALHEWHAHPIDSGGDQRLDAADGVPATMCVWGPDTDVAQMRALRELLDTRDACLLEPTLVAAEEGGLLRELGYVITRDAALASLLTFPQLPSVRTAADAFITDSVGGALNRLMRGL